MRHIAAALPAATSGAPYWKMPGHTHSVDALLHVATGTL